jgi:probable rRNA maturation factor
LSVFLADEQAESVDVVALKHLADILLAEEGYPDETEVTILLVTDEEIAEYNQRFLDRDGPTDVLAFPVEDLIPGVVPDRDPHGPPLILGDVLVAPAYVRNQAKDLEVAFEDEMSLMVAHGILHLLGYDHEEEEDAVRMERREVELLEMVGRKRR